MSTMSHWMPWADMIHLATISFQFLGQICDDMGQEPYIIHLCVCADANRASPEGDMPELCTQRIATHTHTAQERPCCKCSSRWHCCCSSSLAVGHQRYGVVVYMIPLLDSTGRHSTLTKRAYGIDHLHPTCSHICSPLSTKMLCQPHAADIYWHQVSARHSDVLAVGIKAMLYLFRLAAILCAPQHQLTV
jgi:hypothetical protein